MAVEERGTTTGKKASTTTLAITLPAGTVSGDYAILLCWTTAVEGVWTTPAGWEEVAGSAVANEQSGKKSLKIFKRALTGTTGENLPTIKASVSGTIEYFVVVVKAGSYDAANPIDTHSVAWQETSGLSPTFTDGTTTVTGDLLALFSDRVLLTATGFTKVAEGGAGSVYTEAGAPEGPISVSATKSASSTVQVFFVAFKAPVSGALKGTSTATATARASSQAPGTLKGAAASTAMLFARITSLLKGVSAAVATAAGTLQSSGILRGASSAIATAKGVLGTPLGQAQVYNYGTIGSIWQVVAPLKATAVKSPVIVFLHETGANEPGEAKAAEELPKAGEAITGTQAQKLQAMNEAEYAVAHGFCAFVPVYNPVSAGTTLYSDIDLLMAWVKANAEAWNGDPAQVFIIGASLGSVVGFYEGMKLNREHGAGYVLAQAGLSGATDIVMVIEQRVAELEARAAWEAAHPGFSAGELEAWEVEHNFDKSPPTAHWAKILGVTAAHLTEPGWLHGPSAEQKATLKLAEELSPVDNLSSLMPRTWYSIAATGDQTPLAQGTRMTEAIAAAGLSSKYTFKSAGLSGHGYSYFGAVRDEIFTFLTAAPGAAPLQGRVAATAAALGKLQAPGKPAGNSLAAVTLLGRLAGATAQLRGAVQALATLAGRLGAGGPSALIGRSSAAGELHGLAQGQGELTGHFAGAAQLSASAQAPARARGTVAATAQTTGRAWAFGLLRASINALSTWAARLSSETTGRHARVSNVRVRERVGVNVRVRGSDDG